MGLIYLCFSETDRDFVKNIAKHAKDPEYENLKFASAPLLERWDTNSLAVMQIFILKIMKHTNRTIVLIGDDTHESNWVPIEVDLTIELKNPLYAMRIKGSRGEIPDCLIEHGIKVEDWNIEVLQFLATK